MFDEGARDAGILLREPERFSCEQKSPIAGLGFGVGHRKIESEIDLGALGALTGRHHLPLRR
ncbi:MAG: hypothetical protein BGO02_00185 [Brevundimonas sp. 67-6]|nr:MAG: hypothetical protein BGO02_00185 [Brevundimonas sp. 67-6]